MGTIEQMSAKVEADISGAERGLRKVQADMDRTERTYIEANGRMRDANVRFVQSTSDAAGATGKLDRGVGIWGRIRQAVSGVHAPTSLFTGLVDKARGAIGSLGDSAGRVMGAIGQGFGMGAGIALFQKLADTAKEGVTAFADYESEMGFLQAVTGATKGEMDGLRKTAVALGNDVSLPGASAASAAAAMSELAKAGLSVADSQKAAKGVIQLATAAQMNQSDAALTVAETLNAFALSGDKATRIADLLAASVGAAGVKIPELAQGMSQASAVFKQANRPVEDLIVQMDLLAKAGIKGSDAGTSLKTMMLSLLAPSAEAGKAMAAYGISVRGVDGQLKSTPALIDEFAKKLGGLSAAQRDAALKTIFGTDAYRAASVVLMGGTAAYDKMKVAIDKTGKAGELAASRNAGLKGLWEGIANAADTAALTFGEKAAPGVEKITKAIGGLLTGASGLAPVLGEAFTRGVDGVIWFGQTVATTAKVVRKALGEADDLERKSILEEWFDRPQLQMVYAAVTAVREFGIRAVTLARQVPAAFAQIQANPAVKGVLDSFTKLDGLGRTLATTMQGQLPGAVQALQAPLTALQTALGPLLDRGFVVWKTTIDGLVTSTQALIPGLGQLAGGALQALSAVLTPVVDAFGFLARHTLDLANSLQQNLQPAMQGISEMAGKVFGGLAGVVRDAGTAIGSILNVALREAIPHIDRVVEAARPLIDSVGRALRDAVNAAKPKVDELVAAFNTHFRPALDEARKTIEYLIGKLTGSAGFKIAVDSVVFVLRGLADLVDKVVKPILVALVKTSIDLLTGSFRILGDAVTLIARLLRGDFKGALEAVGNLVMDMGRTFESVGRNLLEGLWWGIQGAASWLRARFGEFFGSLLPQWVKDMLGIRSPSRVFADIGAQLPTGLVAGMDRNVSVVRAAASRMVQAAMPSEADLRANFERYQQAEAKYGVHRAVDMFRGMQYRDAYGGITTVSDDFWQDAPRNDSAPGVTPTAPSPGMVWTGTEWRTPARALRPIQSMAEYDAFRGSGVVVNVHPAPGMDERQLGEKAGAAAGRALLGGGLLLG